MDEINRLRSWIRDYGDQKEPTFIKDLEAVLAIADEAVAMTKQRSALQKPLEDVLLSQDFLSRFAEAFSNTPLPTSGDVWPPSSHVR